MVGLPSSISVLGPDRTRLRSSSRTGFRVGGVAVSRPGPSDCAEPSFRGSSCPPRVARYGHDAQIDLWRQPPVKADFLVAPMPPFFECAVIDKPQIDGFLDLVSVRSGQEYDGDVGLVDVNVVNRSGIGLRVAEGLDQ